MSGSSILASTFLCHVLITQQDDTFSKRSRANPYVNPGIEVGDTGFDSSLPSRDAWAIRNEWNGFARRTCTKEQRAPSAKKKSDDGIQHREQREEKQSEFIFAKSSENTPGAISCVDCFFFFSVLHILPSNSALQTQNRIHS
jgi:hypothetical protein